MSKKIEFFPETMGFEYIRSPGNLVGKFLSNIKEDSQIIAIRCSMCSTTFSPPQLYCSECKSKMTNFINLPGVGKIQYFTTVKKETPFTKFPIPFSYVAIQMNGADNIFWHRMKDTDIQTGIEVKPVFKEKEARDGTILDIDYFEKA